MKRRRANRNKRRALLALLLIVPAPTIGVLTAMVWMPGTTLGQIIFFICKIWMLLFPVTWRIVVDQEPLTLSPARRGGFGMGLLSGLAIGAAIFAAYKLVAGTWIDAAHVRAEAIENGIGTVPRYLGAVAYWILFNSLIEEYVYRWFIYRKWADLVPARVAILLSALCFTIHHVIALRLQFDWMPTILASGGVFLGGAIWSWMYRRYRSIWPGYLSHAIVDVAVFVIGWTLIFGGAPPA